MLFHEEKMCAENMELILNYRKYKLVFFLVTNNSCYVSSSYVNQDLLLCIFIKPYRLELKVIYQLVSTKTTRLLVLVFKESNSKIDSENSASFVVPVFRRAEMFKLITRNVHEYVCGSRPCSFAGVLHWAFNPKRLLLTESCYITVSAWLHCSSSCFKHRTRVFLITQRKTSHPL